MAVLLFSDEELQTIELMAGTNYTPRQIAMYLSVKFSDFMKLFNDKNSSVRVAYERGQLESTFEVHRKQIENARSGNITAAQIFLKESKEIQAHNILNRVLYGEDYD